MPRFLVHGLLVLEMELNQALMSISQEASLGETPSAGC